MVFLVASVSFSFVAISISSQTTTTSSQAISVTSVTTASTSTSVRGWINSTAGFGSYPPVTFGADDSRDISPIGPSVELGTTNYTTTNVPANTLVAESFPILGSTVFSMVMIAFSVPKNGPEVTMAAYVNGSLLVRSTRSLNLGIGQNITVAPMISESTYFFLNQTYALTAGSVVTIAFLASGPVSVFPIGGITGSSIMVSNTGVIPSTLSYPPPGATRGPVFLAVGLANPSATVTGLTTHFSSS